jgi:hypothetical protein
LASKTRQFPVASYQFKKQNAQFRSARFELATGN